MAPPHSLPGCLLTFGRIKKKYFIKLELCTANEGPVKIQYKCLVPIYVFPEMKLRGLVISKTEL
jgi:hypothetical protein